MIKLIKNELIKIFKRKSIYFLFLCSLIAIIIYNLINPDQNKIITKFENDINISGLEKSLENMPINSKEYIEQKTDIDFTKIYNNYKKGTWQRYLLIEETSNNNIANIEVNYDHDIISNLKNINDYELNSQTLITENEYINSKVIIEDYIKKLQEDDWKKFVKLRIENLTNYKKDLKRTELERKLIDVEIETYNLRLNNNIEYKDDMLNQYLEEYKNSNYLLVFLSQNTNINMDKEQANQYKAISALSKYAIENKIELDLSQENFNVILNNKIDARSMMLRTFKHFNIIIVIITIYISCIILSEEFNKKTIKSLLSKPHKRSTILLSKIASCIITSAISIILILIFQYIIGGIVYGFDSYKLGFVGYNYFNGKIITMNLFTYMALVGLSKLPIYLIISILCILISIFCHNTSMTMIITLILFVLSDTVIAEWSNISSISNVSKFFITNNWDFSNYLFSGYSYINDINYKFSILIYGIYLILLLSFLFHKFNKKDITNV